MAVKFITLCLLLVVTACSSSEQKSATSTASQTAYYPPLHQQQQKKSSNDPSYTFRYAVHDSWTGDIKSQQEIRHSDRVRGEYRMLESDGTERIVEYSADDHNGFNAIVRHEPQKALLARIVPVVVPRIVTPLPAYATSNSHIVQYYDTPLIISNRVRHN